MAVSMNRGTPMSTAIHDNPYYTDPNKGTLNFGKSLYPWDIAWHITCGCAYGVT